MKKVDGIKMQWLYSSNFLVGYCGRIDCGEIYHFAGSLLNIASFLSNHMGDEQCTICEKSGKTIVDVENGNIRSRSLMLQKQLENVMATVDESVLRRHLTFEQIHDQGLDHLYDHEDYKEYVELERFEDKDSIFSDSKERDLLKMYDHDDFANDIEKKDRKMKNNYEI